MMLILPVLLGIAIALARGGSLRNLTTAGFRGMGAIMASFLIQLVTYAPPMRDTALVRQHGGAIFVVVLALMLIGVARNWDLGLSARVILLGLVLNTAVVVANGGHMPVNAAALRSTQGETLVQEIGAHKYAGRALADHASLLLPLSDIIPVSIPFFPGMVCSLGDLLLTAGGATLAYGVTRRPNRRVGRVAHPVALLVPGTGQLVG
ncbi:MAG TPA: DUF5317 family protein [Chloroflexota bacterium]|nr:DUF5317 family protein [Chloroflexota bacterium]